MLDKYGRTIDYMRISITDRCNLRCKYCMPEGIKKISMDEILTFEEIIKIIEEATLLGIKHIKITGGEPLVRKGCCDLIRQIKNIEGIESVSLTTNGVLIKEYYQDLLDSKVDAINISVDTLHPKVYEQITGKNALQDVLEGMQLLEKTNIKLKINVVSLNLMHFSKDCSKDYIFDLLQIARDYKIDIRFIEVMPIGLGKNFTTINNMELMDRIRERYPLRKDDTKHGNGPAVYYKIDGFKGSIGFISAMHGKFCDVCNRIRITSTGDLKPCLCFDTTINLKDKIRNNESILKILKYYIFEKPNAHCFDDVNKISELKNMHSIGG